MLFLAGALGALGPWSLGTSVVLLVGTAVSTAIAWEDQEAMRPQAFARDDQG
jgi:hypothetical protein